MTGNRDYSLTGIEGRLAVARGLASAEWYASPIPRKRMKELMRRSDQPALRDTAIWLGAMALFGGLGACFWGSWRAAPFFLCYGVLYGSASDARWHECGHGTAFRTRWMNDVVYHSASFMITREPTVWRAWAGAPRAGSASAKRQRLQVARARRAGSRAVSAPYRRCGRSGVKRRPAWQGRYGARPWRIDRPAG